MTITVKTQQEWVMLLAELQNSGFLNGVNIKDIFISKDRFPIEFSIDATPILAMANNPVVKPFRKKIDETIKDNLLKVVKEGVC